LLFKIGVNMQKIFYIKNSFLTKFWLIPVSFLYIFSLLQGDIYTNGKNLLAYLLSIIFILATIQYSTFLYNEIQNDIVSEIPPYKRILKTGFKVNIVLFLILVAVYWSVIFH